MPTELSGGCRPEPHEGIVWPSRPDADRRHSDRLHQRTTNQRSLHHRTTNQRDLHQQITNQRGLHQRTTDARTKAQALYLVSIAKSGHGSQIGVGGQPDEGPLRCHQVLGVATVAIDAGSTPYGRGRVDAPTLGSA